MNERHILEKLKFDKPLTLDEQAWLDARLDESSPVADLVKALRGDAPSMEWRSELSARILNEAAKKKRPAFSLARLGGIGIAGAAAAFVLSFLLQGEEITISADTLSKWHEEAVAATVLPDGGTDLAGFSTLPRRVNQKDSDDILYKGSLHSL
jgi:hypothetical protein